MSVSFCVWGWKWQGDEEPCDLRALRSPRHLLCARPGDCHLDFPGARQLGTLNLGRPAGATAPVGSWTPLAGADRPPLRLPSRQATCCSGTHPDWLLAGVSLTPAGGTQVSAGAAVGQHIPLFLGTRCDTLVSARAGSMADSRQGEWVTCASSTSAAVPWVVRLVCCMQWDRDTGSPDGHRRRRAVGNSEQEINPCPLSCIGIQCFQMSLFGPLALSYLK